MRYVLRGSKFPRRLSILLFVLSNMLSLPVLALASISSLLQAARGLSSTNAHGIAMGVGEVRRAGSMKPGIHINDPILQQASHLNTSLGCVEDPEPLCLTQS